MVLKLKFFKERRHLRPPDFCFSSIFVGKILKSLGPKCVNDMLTVAMNKRRRFLVKLLEALCCWCPYAANIPEMLDPDAPRISVVESVPVVDCTPDDASIPGTLACPGCSWYVYCCWRLLCC